MRFFHKYQNHTTFENKQIPSRKPDVSLCSIEGSSRNGMHYNYLPYDTEIEYLESTGTQCIDTKVIPYRGLKATIDFQYTSLKNEQALFGSWITNPTVIYEVTLYNSKWYFGSYSTSENNIPWLNNVVDTKRHTISIDGNGSISQDDVTLLTTSNVSNNTSYSTVCIFGRTVRGDIQTSTMSSIRCYSFKLAENNKLIFDAIPVRVGNVGYMYDKVSKQLFGNSGTGNFTLGQDIIPIEYIRSTGTEYIDTGIYGTMDLDFYIEFEPTELGTAYQKTAGSIFGSRTGWNQQAYQLTTYNKVSSYSASTRGHFLCANNYGWNDNKTPTANMLLNKKNIIKKENLLFTRADGTTFTLTSQSFTTAASIRIFQCAGAGEPSKIKLYNLKFSRNGNILRNFIPVRVGTVGYLFDKVNRQLYGNAGSGAFTLGPDII